MSNTGRYEVGEKLVVVAKVGLFAPLGERLQPEAIKGLHLVEITVTEEVNVPGNYTPGSVHKGYFGKGTDGWKYQCQGERFDETSSSPYQTWLRCFTEGEHYARKEGGGIGEWLIDKQAEFLDRYLNWEVTFAMNGMPQETQTALAARVNQSFPECGIQVCSEHPAGSEEDHSQFGYFYSKDGCGMCALMAKDAVAQPGG